ncbi:MAG: phosphonate ABC transporter, permease protein PhnE [Chloroflexota bacterium]|nr:phosphonate ABC transporter, permease protein PhnE [Chloroflexota bacterium]
MTGLSANGDVGIGIDAGRLLANLTRGVDVIAELFRPNWDFLPRTVAPMTETLQMAVLASVVGCGSALPIAFLVSRVTSPSRRVLAIGRAVLSVVRSVPDILYALFFIAAVGIGPLAGILALVFFNVGIVAKLLSETVDGVDLGPIEAGRASGASGTQTVRWAVLPQVLPNYVAYSLYVFELNVRASTVLGIVGAGGIGRLLYAEYGLFRWSNMSVIIVELFVFVFLIELVSMWLRRRLV